MQNLTDRLEQSWQVLYRRWKCELGYNYGQHFVAPMRMSLEKFEASADRLTDEALELDAVLRDLERKGGWCL